MTPAVNAVNTAFGPAASDSVNRHRHPPGHQHPQYPRDSRLGASGGAEFDGREGGGSRAGSGNNMEASGDVGGGAAGDQSARGVSKRQEGVAGTPPGFTRGYEYVEYTSSMDFNGGGQAAVVDSRGAQQQQQLQQLQHVSSDKAVERLMRKTILNYILVGSIYVYTYCM